VINIIKVMSFPVLFRFRSSSGDLKYCCYFLHYICNIIRAVHTLDPGETPSYSLSHQDPTCVQRFYISQDILKRFDMVTVRFRLFLFQFT